MSGSSDFPATVDGHGVPVEDPSAVAEATLRVLGPVERFVTRLEEPPWLAIHRVAIGWLIYPVLSWVCGENAEVWAWVLTFLGILLGIRVGPAIVRKLLPFSDSAQATWFARRQVAKRYDSYQWQKLLWIGLGLALYAAWAAEFRTAPLLLTSACLFSGALGLATWRVRKARALSPEMAAPQRARGLA